MSSNPIPPIPAPSSEPSPRRKAVDRARQGWIARLIDLSQRNNLIYFRPLKVGTLDLTFANRDMLADLLGGTKSVLLSKLLPDADEDRLLDQVKDIARKARENFEERGLETLFLAAGMATWKPDEGKRAPESAILLVPVAIEAKARSKPAIRRIGDVQVNPVLLHLLTTTFRTTISPEEILSAADTDPDREDDAFDLDALLEKFASLASKVPQFAVRRTIMLGNFSFQKMAMVRDLTDLPEALTKNPVVAGLAGDGSARAELLASQPAIDPHSFDNTPPEKEFLILDTDSTQHVPIAAALAGSSGVIQGPPGTGKSQVIANLIASAAATGKRILFVAEKRAALDVVLDRLDKAGLGHLALDLHGAVTSRKQIAMRIREAMENVSKGEPIPPADPGVTLADRRTKLHAHAERINAKRAPSDLSVYDIQGRLLNLPSELQTKTRFRNPTLQGLTPAALAESKDLLNQAAGLTDLLLRQSPSPWTNAQLPDGTAAQQAYDRSADLADRFPDIRDKLLRLIQPLRSKPPESLADGLRLTNILNNATTFLSAYNSTLFTLDLPALARQLAPAESGFITRLLVTIFSSTFRQAKRTLQQHRISSAPADKPNDDLRAAVALQARWREAGFTSANPVASPESRELLPSLTQFEADLRVLSTALRSDELANLPLADLEARLNALRNDPGTARRVPALYRVTSKLDSFGLSSFLTELTRSQSPAASWPALLEHAWLHSCLEQAWIDDPELSGFQGDVHSRFVDEFRELDRERLSLASRRIARKHVAAVAIALQNNPTQASFIRREAEKKTRHATLRKLMDQSADVLTTLFPCFMCSPLSVSQLLPGDQPLFDMVVFDEASQVLPEDAVSALVRAKQAIVAGDQHQLPPTPFFASGEEQPEEDETDDESQTEGFESLLSMMSSFVPSWMLQWHYRSRDERLIAFSNQHIYSSRLVTFPAPSQNPSVTHVLVKLAANDEKDPEIARVVQIILDHAAAQLAKPDPKQRRTLGIIALGIPHARKIEAALEKALQQRPELDPFFDENAAIPFFIKNLERVQGDERDTILLTLGVDKDASGKVPLTRFGPLNNRDNGHRRLNVAITRARHQMILVSTFTHHELNAANASQGVSLLRDYLQYAAVASAPTSNATSASPGIPNPFLDHLAAQLKSHNIPYVLQHGVSAFRIDVALLHPNRPDRFVLAVETDGPTYHNAPTTRDRDRLRQQHLQALGWDFHRIWSTDFFHHPDGEFTRLLSTYQSAAKQADQRDNIPSAP